MSLLPCCTYAFCLTISVIYPPFHFMTSKHLILISSVFFYQFLRHNCIFAFSWSLRQPYPFFRAHESTIELVQICPPVSRQTIQPLLHNHADNTSSIGSPIRYLGTVKNTFSRSAYCEIAESTTSLQDSKLQECCLLFCSKQPLATVTLLLIIT